MSWRQHFKEQLQLLDGKSDLKQGSAEQLRFVIEQELLKEDEYFEFLKKQAHHPLVKGTFFTDIKPTRAFWTRHREKMTWSENLLPITEWDGHLVIGGLVLPENLPQGSIFVYAPLQGLSRYWTLFQEYDANAEVADAPAQSVPQSSAPNTDANKLELIDDVNQTPEAANELPEGINFDSLEVPTFVRNVSELNLQVTEDSIVFDGNTKIDSTNEDAEALDLNANESLATPSSSPGMDFNFQALSSNESHDVENTPTPEDEIVAINSDPEIDISASKVDYIKPTELEKEAPKVEPAAGKKEVNQKPEKSAQVARFTSISNPTDLHFETQQMGYNLSRWDDSLLKKAFTPFIGELKTQFDKVAIINISNNEERAKLYAWDNGFQHDGSNDRPINLNTPSVFYIASKTSKPFHGPISPNEINSEFFKVWNNNQIPEHLTIFPIIVNDSLVALALGIADASKFNRSTLHMVEKSAKLVQDSLAIFTTNAA